MDNDFVYEFVCHDRNKRHLSGQIFTGYTRNYCEREAREFAKEHGVSEDDWEIARIHDYN